MANPQIPQGGLNRLIASVNFPSFPGLNITSPFLGKNGFHLVLEGKSVAILPSMTGVVTSPEPYMLFMLTAELLKSQALSDAYKQQMELNCVIGDCSVWPDSTTLGVYQLRNASLTGVRDLPFNGQDAVFAVTIEGYYQTNSSLYGL